MAGMQNPVDIANPGFELLAPVPGKTYYLQGDTGKLYTSKCWRSEDHSRQEHSPVVVVEKQPEKSKWVYVDPTEMHMECQRG